MRFATTSLLWIRRLLLLWIRSLLLLRQRVACQRVKKMFVAKARSVHHLSLFLALRNRQDRKKPPSGNSGNTMTMAITNAKNEAAVL